MFRTGTMEQDREANEGRQVWEHREAKSQKNKTECKPTTLWLREPREFLGVQAQGEPEGSSTAFQSWRKPELWWLRTLKFKLS